MAGIQIGPIRNGITNSQRAVSGQLGGASNFTTPVNYSSITALRSALSTANGTYYTTARLDSMTVNDMIFALRSIQDPKTISDYFTAQAA
jgi:hypothetical protein